MITLSSNDLTLILYVIGRSERPLTSQEIRNQIDISNSKKKSGWYGREILKELVPTGEIMRDKRICLLEEILSKDINKKFESINNLEKALDLNWNISKEDLETKSVKVKEENIDTNVEQSSLDWIIDISIGNARKITIITKKDIEDKEWASVIISDGDYKKNKKLFIEQNQQKKLTAYTIKNISNPISYLDITYDNETQKIISSLENNRTLNFFLANKDEIIKGIKQEDRNIEKEIKSIINIENIKNDRSKWRFSINLRGFLLYLICVNHNNKITKLLDPKRYNKDIKKPLDTENHRDIRRIKQVLSNPTIKNKFIFLNSWEKFEEKGFKVIEILVNIANEFKEQLGYDKQNLLIRVTERYLFEIDKYFINYSFNLSLNQETENMLNQYRLMILEFLEKELILYTNRISKQIQYIKSGIEE